MSPMPQVERSRWIGVGAVLLAGACGPARPATESVRGALSSAPLVGAELPVDDVVYTQETGQQTVPFIAGGGPGALLVWRNDPLPGFAVSPLSVNFARIDPEGNFLDPVPVTIGTPTDLADPAGPSAAWNGNQALVLWPVAILTSTGGTEVHGSRITEDGTVLDPGTATLPGGIVVEIGGSNEYVYNLSIVPFGDGFMVFWATINGSPFCNRVGADGSVSSTTGVPVALPADGIARSVEGEAAVKDGVLVIVGEAGGGLKVMKVDGNGAVLVPLSSAAGSTGTTIAPVEAIAWNGGDGAVLCWGEQSASGQPVTIYGRRMDANTTTWIDSAPFQLRAAGAKVSQIAALWDGTRYVCSWTDASARLVVQPVAASGTPLVGTNVGPATLSTTAVQSAQLAWAGSDYAVAMTRTIDARVDDNYGDNPDGVLLRMLGPDLQPLGTDAAPVTRQPNQQLTPRAAATPDGVYVAYSDDRRRGNLTMQGAYNLDSYGAFVTVSGGALTRTVTPLWATTSPAYNPCVSWNGSQLMLFYETAPDSAEFEQDYVQLASASGTTVGNRIGPLGVAVTGVDTLTLWNGQNLLVATVERDGGGNSLEFFRVSPAGTVLDPSTPMKDGPSVEMGELSMDTLQGVALGDKYLLVGDLSPLNSTGLASGDYDIDGLVVNADGTPAATKLVPIATGTAAQDVPSVATDGTSALVIWRDRGAAGSAIVAARVDATLARLDATDVVIAQASPPTTLGAPAVTWTGSAYAVVWTEGSGGTLAFDGCLLGADLHCVPGSQSSTSSGIADMLTTAVDGGVVGSGEVQAPALSWTTAGGVLSYLRLDTSPGVNVQRLFLRAVTLGAASDGGVAGSSGGGGKSANGGTAGAGGGGGSSAGSGGAGGAASGGSGGAAGGSGGASGAAGNGTANGGRGGASQAGGAGGSAADGGAGATMSGGGSGCGCAMGEGGPGSAFGALLVGGLVLSRRRRP
jgi:hypothetical protein